MCRCTGNELQCKSIRICVDPEQSSNYIVIKVNSVKAEKGEIRYERFDEDDLTGLTVGFWRGSKLTLFHF